MAKIMRRRSFLKTLGLGAGLGAAAMAAPRGLFGTAAAAAQTATAGNASKPNVVIILADDLGYGDISSYHEQSLIKTPNIDKLATQGLKFTDAHSTASVCTPSRYGLLTGRYCWRTVLKKNVLSGYSSLLIDADTPTMPKMFQAKGYKTACVGKWHLGLDWQVTDGAEVSSQGKNVDFSKRVTRGANECGFDYSFITAGCSKIDVPHVFIENGKCTVPPTQWYKVRGKGKDNSARVGFSDPNFPFKDVDKVFVEQSVKFISENKDKPFFLYLPLSAPHAPFWPADFAEGKTHSKRGDLVWQVDWCVGQIEAALRKHGLAENTILVFASDNGPRQGKGGHDPSGPYRGLKTHTWEGGHRIPLIVRWPGAIKPDTKTDQLIELNDLFATFSNMLGAPLTGQTGPDSINMLPVFKGQASGKHLRTHTIHHSNFGVFAIRQENWKLILGTKGSGGWVTPGDKSVKQTIPHNETGQLYDMAKDPYETTDLYEKRPDIVKELTAMLDGFKESGRSVKR